MTRERGNEESEWGMGAENENENTFITENKVVNTRRAVFI